MSKSLTKAKPKSKTKTQPTTFHDFEKTKPPECPHCSSSRHIIKSGTRKLSNEISQMYPCKKCKKRFTIRSIPHTTYPTSIILSALTYFNLGHTLQQTQNTMQRKYKSKIPISTLNTWLKRFEKDLSFIRLRKNKKFTLDPNTIIHSKKFHHQQVYEFKLPEGHPRGT